jgi:hypothetical protein
MPDPLFHPVNPVNPVSKSSYRVLRLRGWLSVMKPSVARISLAVAVVLFFTGFGVLCACPGWYALAAGFAGISVWAGTGRTRKWAIVFLVASLIFTALNTMFLIHERHHKEQARIEETRTQRGEPQPNSSQK